MKRVGEGRPGQGAEEAAAGKRALQRGACQTPVTPTGLLESLLPSVHCHHFILQTVFSTSCVQNPTLDPMEQKGNKRNRNASAFKDILI